MANLPIVNDKTFFVLSFTSRRPHLRQSRNHHLLRSVASAGGIIVSAII